MHQENQRTRFPGESRMASLINRSDISEEFMACPYCYSGRGSKDMCCGEAHFSRAYIVNGKMYFTGEVNFEEASM